VTGTKPLTPLRTPFCGAAGRDSAPRLPSSGSESCCPAPVGAWERPPSSCLPFGASFGASSEDGGAGGDATGSPTGRSGKISSMKLSCVASLADLGMARLSLLRGDGQPCFNEHNSIWCQHPVISWLTTCRELLPRRIMAPGWAGALPRSVGAGQSPRWIPKIWVFRESPSSLCCSGAARPGRRWPGPSRPGGRAEGTPPVSEDSYTVLISIYRPRDGRTSSMLPRVAAPLRRSKGSGNSPDGDSLTRATLILS
jgi:hypothetical protein